MELRHLRYFVAAAEEQHFSKAADRLFVTRPAVSRLISDLEDELGTKLFERSGHRIQLTAGGRTLLARLRPMLAELAVTVELTKKVGTGMSGVLAIGYGSATLQQPVFRDAVKQVHDDLPDVFVSLVEGTSLELVEALRNGKLDAAFTHRAVVGNDSEGDTEFLRRPLGHGRLVAAVPAGHALAGREAVSLADLANEDFIVVPHSNASPSHGALASLFERAGFQARVVQEVRNSATQLNLVAMGVGVGLLLTLPGAVYPEAVRIVGIDGVDFVTRFELICLASRGHEPLIARFMQIVEGIARGA